jgi:mannose-6-phosphate isomerase-like protein (cupin superfamily)
MIKKIFKAKEFKEFYTEEKCFITEMLNTGAFNNFSVAMARVVPGITTTIHRLKETDEVYFIISGRGEMEIDGETLGFVTKNDLVFIPKNTTQRITNVSDKDLIFLCICAPRFEVSNYE